MFSEVLGFLLSWVIGATLWGPIKIVVQVFSPKSITKKILTYNLEETPSETDDLGLKQFCY